MERLLLRPAEVGELIGIGRTRVYQMLGSGELPSIRVGGRLRVPVSKLREWVNDQVQQQRRSGEEK